MMEAAEVLETADQKRLLRIHSLVEHFMSFDGGIRFLHGKKI